MMCNSSDIYRSSPKPELYVDTDGLARVTRVVYRSEHRQARCCCLKQTRRSCLLASQAVRWERIITASKEMDGRWRWTLPSCGAI